MAKKKSNKKGARKKANKGKRGKPSAVKTNRVPTRFNVLQGILASYGRERGIVWGKGCFQTNCSILYGKIKEYDLKFVEQNIDALYREFVETSVPKRDFPTGEEFAWWYFLDEIQAPIFDGVTISFDFDDGFQKFNFKGKREQAEVYWQDLCYSYFRRHYSDSPWAYFLIKTDTDGVPQTDNRTYVDYVIVAGKRTDALTDEQKPTQTPPKPEVKPSATTDDLIRLEQEKQRTLAKVLELMQKGFTKEEIFKLLGQ